MYTNLFFVSFFTCLLSALAIPLFFQNGMDGNLAIAQQIKGSSDTFNPATSTVILKNKVIHVDLALTGEEQTKGLSIKNTMKEDEGMLFIFKTSEKYPFWMKDMKFPIDIIWINSDHKIVHIEKNLQPCILFLLCPTYSPNADSLYVLEVVSNYTNKNNISVGDKVDFNLKNSTKNNP